MRVRDLIEELTKYPEIADYKLCLTKFMTIPKEGTEDENSVEVDLGVLDVPIRGIAIHNEGQEVRFIADNDSARMWEDAEIEYLNLPATLAGHCEACGEDFERELEAGQLMTAHGLKLCEACLKEYLESEDGMDG